VGGRGYEGAGLKPLRPRGGVVGAAVAVGECCDEGAGLKPLQLRGSGAGEAFDETVDGGADFGAGGGVVIGASDEDRAVGEYGA